MDPERDSAATPDWLRPPDDPGVPRSDDRRQPPSVRAAAAVALAAVGMAAGAIFVAATGHGPTGPLRPAVTTVTGTGAGPSSAAHGDDGGYADDGGRAGLAGD